MKSKYLLFFIINFILNLESFEISKDEILIKYSTENTIITYEYLLKKEIIPTFFNLNNNKLDIDIYINLINEKIINLNTKNIGFVRINYDKKNNIIELINFIGDFNVKCFNNYLLPTIIINDIIINLNICDFVLISYPDNIFIYVKEGKLNVKFKKLTIILLSGETINISKDNYELLDINDIDLLKNISINKLLINYNNIKFINELNINNIINKIKKNKKNKLKYYLQLEYLFFSKIFLNYFMKKEKEYNENIIEDIKNSKEILKLIN